MRQTLALLCCALATLAAGATEVQTQGLAPLDEGQSPGAARLQAVRDAERRASEVPGMRISGSDLAPGLSTSQSRGDGRLGESRVISESSSNGMLQVETAVTVNPQGGCAAANYRKKLAVAGFNLAHPEQAGDIYDPGRGYAMELLRALESGRRFQLRNAADISVFPDPNLAPAVVDDGHGDPRAISALGRRMDAQFVVAGAILDLGASDSAYTHGANAFTSLFGFHLEPYQRGLRVGLYVFDSLTGNSLMEQNYEKTVYGDVYFTSGTPFSSREFRESQLGEAVQEIIAQQVKDLTAKLDCLPLMERIVRVEKPHVYINAGSTSNIQVGDTLAVYHQLDKPLPGVYYQNQRLLGYAEELKTTLIITQVQPSFSIGTLESGSAPVSPMDFVRSW